MKQLKGVIFSLRGVLENEKMAGGETFREVVNLFKFLASKDITPVIVSNSQWTMVGTEEKFAHYLSEKVGFEIRHFIGGQEGMPYKQKGGAMLFIADKMGWEPHESVYVGNTEYDMRAARNGGLMFLNAKWHQDNSPYGFDFESPKDIGRFIDCCCLGLGDWF